MADVDIITKMSYPGRGVEFTFDKKQNRIPPPFFKETVLTYLSIVLNSLYILYLMNIHQNFNLVNEKYEQLYWYALYISGGFIITIEIKIKGKKESVFVGSGNLSMLSVEFRSPHLCGNLTEISPQHCSNCSLKTWFQIIKNYKKTLLIYFQPLICGIIYFFKESWTFN